MENHSFDNMLGNLNKTKRGVNATAPSCNTQASTGATYCASARGAWSDPDPDHSVDGTAWQLYGTPNPPAPYDASTVTMSGFVDSYSHAVSQAAGPTIMDCFDPSHVPIVSALAQAFTLVDTYHASVPGPTFPNRLFFLSGTSHGFGDNDDVQTVLGWPQRSIFGALNASQWRVYFSDVPSALLMADARGGLLTGNFRALADFARDAAAGDLADFSFVEPAFMDIPGLPATDQHPAHDVRDGERMIKGVYEALRGSPLWNESAMLLTWDEHGGFYDSVPPPTSVPSPDGLPCSGCKYPGSFNFTRLGVRVPMLVVSPWATASVAPPAPQGSYYDHSSLPATLREACPAAFPQPLSARAAAAQSLAALWEGTQLPGPRADTPATLPEVPAGASPALEGAARDGAGAPNHLQRSLLLLAEAAAAAALGGQGALAGGAQGVAAALERAGALDSEARAGRYARERLGAFVSREA